MDFESSWAQSAHYDLTAIVDYWEGVDPDAIPTVVEPILERTDSLEFSPYVGDVLRRSGKRELRVVLAGTYRVYFQIDPDENTVTIRRILHVRQDDPDFSE